MKGKKSSEVFQKGKGKKRKYPTQRSSHRELPPRRLLVRRTVMDDIGLAQLELYTLWYRNRRAPQLRWTHSRRREGPSTCCRRRWRRRERRHQEGRERYYRRRWQGRRVCAEGCKPRPAWGEHHADADAVAVVVVGVVVVAVWLTQLSRARRNQAGCSSCMGKLARMLT